MAPIGRATGEREESGDENQGEDGLHDPGPLREGHPEGKAPATFNPKNDLPGAINIAFVDGHSELVKLERLWSLDWHKGWVTPAKRPGK